MKLTLKPRNACAQDSWPRFTTPRFRHSMKLTLEPKTMHLPRTVEPRSTTLERRTIAEIQDRGPQGLAKRRATSWAQDHRGHPGSWTLGSITSRYAGLSAAALGSTDSLWASWSWVLVSVLKSVTAWLLFAQVHDSGCMARYFVGESPRRHPGPKSTTYLCWQGWVLDGQSPGPALASD